MRNPLGWIPDSVRLPVGIVGVGALLTFGVLATAPANEPAPRLEKAWAVSTLQARLSELAPELRLFGRVETPRAASLRAAITAEVREVAVREGQPVASGDLLVRLDDREARLLVREREAEAASAAAALQKLRASHGTDRAALERQSQLRQLIEKKLQRERRLHDLDMASSARLEDVEGEAQRQAIELGESQSRVQTYKAERRQLEAALGLAEARLERARLDLERSEIRAPFGGRVASLAVAPGERLIAGSEVLELYDTGALEVRAQIPPDQVAGIREALARSQSGDKPVRAWIRGRSAPIELTLDRMAGRVARGRGGHEALFVITTPSPALELSQVVELDVELPSQSGVVAVPARAVYGASRIYTVEDERLHAVEIERIGERAGPRGALDVLVRSPELEDGAVIAVTQLPRAIDGLKVSVND